MTYCAGCRRSVDHEKGIVGEVIGTGIDFEKKYQIHHDIVLYFCKDCWNEMKKMGIVQS